MTAFGKAPEAGAIDAAVLNTRTIPVGRMFYVTRRRDLKAVTMSTYHYNLEHYELILLTEGTCRCFMGSRLFMLHGDDDAAMMAIMDKGVSHHHSFDGTTYHTLYHVFFNDAYLAHYRDRTGENLLHRLDPATAVSLAESSAAILTGLLDAILREDRRGADPLADPARESLLDLFFMELCRAHRTPVPESAHDLTHPMVLRVIRYIDEHYALPLTLSVIAEELSLNRHYLCRLFRAETNLTVTDYIMRVRVKHACRLLKKGHTGIAAVADAVGYANTAYFSRVFKGLMGMTPNRYRRKANA